MKWNFTQIAQKPRKRRKGVHSKNASKGQTGYKQPRRGQGKNR
jgi:hypothetical protein